MSYQPLYLCPTERVDDSVHCERTMSMNMGCVGMGHGRWQEWLSAESDKIENGAPESTRHLRVEDQPEPLFPDATQPSPYTSVFGEPRDIHLDSLFATWNLGVSTRVLSCSI